MHENHSQSRLNFYCQIMIALLGLIALRLWIAPTDVLPRAQAQFMDAGAQRMQIVKHTEQTVAVLGEIRDALKGTLRVKVEGTAEAKPEATGSRPR